MPASQVAAQNEELNVKLAQESKKVKEQRSHIQKLEKTRAKHLLDKRGLKVTCCSVLKRYEIKRVVWQVQVENLQWDKFVLKVRRMLLLYLPLAGSHHVCHSPCLSHYLSH